MERDLLELDLVSDFDQPPGIDDAAHRPSVADVEDRHVTQIGPRDLDSRGRRRIDPVGPLRANAVVGARGVTEDRELVPGLDPLRESEVDENVIVVAEGDDAVPRVDDPARRLATGRIARLAGRIPPTERNRYRFVRF